MRALVVALVVFLSVPARAATVTATWTGSPGATGYRLQYGPTSGTWPTVVDVGASTTASLTLAPGTYFVTVVAYNATETSGPSVEVSTTIPAVDTSCDYPLGNKAVSVFVTALQKTGSGGALSRARLDFQLASPNSPITRAAITTTGGELAGMTGTDLSALAGLWFTVPAALGVYPLSVSASNAYGCTRDQSTSFVVTVK